MKNLMCYLLLLLASCNSNKNLTFKTIDTDFSKGRLTHVQTITIADLEKLHGHGCDGLILGTLAIKKGMQSLYPNEPIDRTNLRIVSKPSPCLTDVAIYLTGGRYQFNTFYLDTNFNGIYIIQRIDNLKTISILLNQGVKPSIIDSLGALALQKKLTTSQLLHLKKLEDDFSNQLLSTELNDLFTLKALPDFEWKPNLKNNYLKTDIVNK